MKCLLIYYTGTYNTRYISNELKKKLDNDYFVELYEIDPLNNEELDLSLYDVIGLGYPIYGFNAPLPFLKFIRKQKFPKGKRVFIYKNSGETYSANDASSLSVVNYLKLCKTDFRNEYHFMMPYNIHFRYDDKLIKEMLVMDDKLMDILAFELKNNITNRKKYTFKNKIITTAVKLQFIGGNVNSFLYKVDQNKCVNCNKCIETCPTENIYRSEKTNKIKFHHSCLMCMRCSFYCPTNAINIGFLQSWKVNGKYDFEKIKNIKLDKPVITANTTGFFKCYIDTYNYIDYRYNELIGPNSNTDKKND